MREERLDKARYKIYLAKALEFYKLMKYAGLPCKLVNSESEGLWIGAGLNGIHCAISASDALTTFYLGERSTSQKHEDIVVLLRRIETEGISSRIKQLLSILSVKNVVEYEAREFRRSDAVKVITQAERFYMWARQKLLAEE